MRQLYGICLENGARLAKSIERYIATFEKPALAIIHAR